MISQGLHLVGGKKSVSITVVKRIFQAVLSQVEIESHSVMSNSLRPHRLYSLWNSPGQNTGVGSLSLLHGIFPTEGSNPGLPLCRRIFYQLSYQGSPRIMEWQPIPSPADLPDPGIKPRSPALQEDFLPTELSGKPQVRQRNGNQYWMLHKHSQWGWFACFHWHKDCPPHHRNTLKLHC